MDRANDLNDAYGAIMDAYEMDKTLGVVIEFLKLNTGFF
ncbi:MAG: hypothetical protein N2513_09805 [Deltaproteobacteria bacterium]|nr:hypothetical protein [Deltaproteobacteria bacterium]